MDKGDKKVTHLHRLSVHLFFSDMVDADADCALLHTPDIKCTYSERCSHTWLRKVKTRLCHLPFQRLSANSYWSTLMTKPHVHM